MALGRRSSGRLGQDALTLFKESLTTAQDIQPALRFIADDYINKISPLVDWFSRNWPVTLVLIFLASAGGSTLGSFITLKRIEKKRS